MKLNFSILTLAFLAFATFTHAGNLQIVVLDFGSNEVDSNSLQKNLQTISLRSLISSSAKMPTSLQNASILFAQNIPALRNSSPSSFTISGNSFSQLNARLDHSSIRLNLRISLAPEFDLGSPTQFLFNASGPLPSGSPVVLSVQKKNTFLKTTSRGIPTVKKSQTNRAIIAQFNP